MMAGKVEAAAPPKPYALRFYPICKNLIRKKKPNSDPTLLFVSVDYDCKEHEVQASWTDIMVECEKIAQYLSNFGLG